jgi:type IV secretory pathway VirB6-like protein
MRGIKDKLSEYKYSGKVKYFLQNQDYELGQEDLATQLKSAQMLRIDYSSQNDFDASNFFSQNNQSQDNGHNTTSSKSQSAQFIISRRPSKVNYFKRILPIILSTLAFIAILAGAPFYLGYISFHASIEITIACLVGIFIIPSLVSVIIEKKLKEKTNAAVRSWIDIIIFCILAHFITPIQL